MIDISNINVIIIIIFKIIIDGFERRRNFYLICSGLIKEDKNISSDSTVAILCGSLGLKELGH